MGREVYSLRGTVGVLASKPPWPVRASRRAQFTALRVRFRRALRARTRVMTCQAARWSRRARTRTWTDQPRLSRRLSRPLPRPPSRRRGLWPIRGVRRPRRPGTRRCTRAGRICRTGWPRLRRLRRPLHRRLHHPPRARLRAHPALHPRARRVRPIRVVIRVVRDPPGQDRRVRVRAGRARLARREAAPRLALRTGPRGQVPRGWC